MKSAPPPRLQIHRVSRRRRLSPASLRSAISRSARLLPLSFPPRLYLALPYNGCCRSRRHPHPTSYLPGGPRCRYIREPPRKPGVQLSFPRGTTERRGGACALVKHIDRLRVGGSRTGGGFSPAYTHPHPPRTVVFYTPRVARFRPVFGTAKGGIRDAGVYTCACKGVDVYFRARCRGKKACDSLSLLRQGGLLSAARGRA